MKKCFFCNAEMPQQYGIKGLCFTCSNKEISFIAERKERALKYGNDFNRKIHKTVVSQKPKKFLNLVAKIQNSVIWRPTQYQPKYDINGKFYWYYAESSLYLFKHEFNSHNTFFATYSTNTDEAVRMYDDYGYCLMSCYIEKDADFQAIMDNNKPLYQQPINNLFCVVQKMTNNKLDFEEILMIIVFLLLIAIVIKG